MNTSFADTDTQAKWDELLVQNPDGGNVFATREMAETKRRNGWLPRYALVEGIAVTILEKKVPLLGGYWYLPKGPSVTTLADMERVLPKLERLARESGVFAIKIEPEIIETDEALAALSQRGFVRTSPVQPNVSTVLLDLEPPLDGVMAALNQKGRHAIRRAERDGVVAKAVDLTEENMKTMYNLLRSTAEGRFEASVRDYNYYKSYWQTFHEAGHGQLFFAYVEGEVVAGAYAMLLGAKGLYKDGVSVREKVVYGASHLLQWEIIKWMKDRGVQSYDFCGAPHSTQVNNESHKFYGVGRFKTSFNKHVTDYVGCWDVPIRPTAYRIWRSIGERLAISLTWRLKKQQWF